MAGDRELTDSEIEDTVFEGAPLIDTILDDGRPVDCVGSDELLHAPH